MPLLNDREMTKLVELRARGICGPEHLLAIKAIATVAQETLATWTDRYTPVIFRGKDAHLDNVEVLDYRMQRLLAWVDEELQKQRSA